MTATRGLRAGLCGVVLAPLAAPAMAWNEPLWVRHSGHLLTTALPVATDGAGNVYITGYTNGSLGGPSAGGFDAWVVKYSTRR